MKKEINLRYTVLGTILILFTLFSLRHFILGGGAAASVDALCPFGGFETLFTFIATGGFVPRILMSSLILALGVLVTVILFRRGFCGYICPFGTVQELCGKITKKRINVPVKFDIWLRYLKYLILIAILVGTAYTGTLIFRGYDPFLTFFHFGKGVFWKVETDGYFGHVVALIITVIILILTVFIERAWCKYFCPLGATMNIFAKVGITGIFRNKKKCTNCKICDKICPVNVCVSKVKKVRSAECINCNQCITACPEDALYLKALGKKYSVFKYIIFLITVFFLIIFVSQMFGVWQSVPSSSLKSLGGDLDSSNIRGWMTIKDVARETGIEVDCFINDLDLPETIDIRTPLKDISAEYNIDFETQMIRDYVAGYPFVSEEKVECPWGINEDPYPGRCGLYVDKDNNHICDYSE